MDADRNVWVVRVVIEATEEQKDAALEAIERALCPDESHSGYCPVPWTTMVCRFDDLDAEERESWKADFDEDRRAARDAGVDGA